MLFNTVGTSVFLKKPIYSNTKRNHSPVGNLSPKGCVGVLASLYHTFFYEEFFSGPKVSHAHARSFVLCIPFQMVS
ncbi:MAG: hypothetical protein LBT09_15055, partial [Planctomycetaceae bacterium]|nr:hypothetical protein [Planctomycetaceae bacterium]